MGPVTKSVLSNGSGGGGDGLSTPTNTPANSSATIILNRLKLNEENIRTKQMKQLLQENHLKRLKIIRKEMDYLEETAWNYRPIEYYIGQ